ncbi:hypothetical protein [Tenacibaculum sp. 190524A02b]
MKLQIGLPFRGKPNSNEIRGDFKYYKFGVYYQTEKKNKIDSWNYEDIGL